MTYLCESRHNHNTRAEAEECNRQWLKKRAEDEDQFPSIGVGGLASDLGMLTSPDPYTPDPTPDFSGGDFGGSSDFGSGGGGGSDSW